MALYVLGKVTCDAINKQPWRPKREYGRWAVMGCLDGYFTHAWYWYIEMAASGLQPLLKLSSMVRYLPRAAPTRLLICRLSHLLPCFCSLLPILFLPGL